MISLSGTSWVIAIKNARRHELQRKDVAAAREQWQARQQHCDLFQLVFLSETGLSTDMIRRYGRALGGARCRDAAPASRWQTMTLIAGLRADRIAAPWCVDQAMAGEAFKEYLRLQLRPTLKPGGIVLQHKGRRLYLPPYNHDLNPIKQVFARLKARRNALMKCSGARSGN
ncbi:transposase [Methylobacter sp. sgz302048]|uniref:transposase n=1 Tax=Methylobacter sp. sgz302048 TaxID=3455945 RepID=UPI003FA0BC5E